VRCVTSARVSNYIDSIIEHGDNASRTLLKQQGAGMENRLRSIEETSQRLGVSTFTTRRLIKAGQIKAVRISKRVMVPESELNRLIAQGCGKHVSNA
jgi:excisionase family DNA binding protein